MDTMDALAGLPFAHPWVLLALPLAVLALWQRPQVLLLHSWSALLPRDPLSRALDVGLRALAALAVLALLVGIAGLYRPAYEVERIGRGAEIVLLVDRSRSMDQNFVTRAGRYASPSAGLGDFNISREQADEEHASKQRAARRLLARFAAQRPADRFSMIAFSTLPIRVLDFTEKPEAVQAAIMAGEVGRGLAETDIGLALREAVDSFRGRPYTGSRIIVLVSDGGDILDAETRAEVARGMRDYRVTLYWLYIRSARGAGLRADVGERTEAGAAQGETAPEVFLHRFFDGMGTPYKAYEADNPQALEAAIADVNRLENLPIVYRDTVPRRDLSPWCYGVALAAVLLLLAAKLMELRAWR